MPQTSYSDDEPRLIKPSGPNYRLYVTVAAIFAALFFLGSVLAMPLYNNWQENQAHEAKRGIHEGAVYPVSIDGKTYQMELGWIQGRLGVVLRIPDPEKAQVTLKGRFGTETLKWNPQLSAFGPVKVELDPFKHYKVQIAVESGGKVLWSGKEWAWGIHDHHHHH